MFEYFLESLQRYLIDLVPGSSILQTENNYFICYAASWLYYIIVQQTKDGVLAWQASNSPVAYMALNTVPAFVSISPKACQTTLPHCAVCYTRFNPEDIENVDAKDVKNYVLEVGNFDLMCNSCEQGYQLNKDGECDEILIPKASGIAGRAFINAIHCPHHRIPTIQLHEDTFRNRFSNFGLPGLCAD